MLLMTSLPVADCSIFLSLQRGMLDRQRCAVESVVRQAPRLTTSKDILIQEDRCLASRHPPCRLGRLDSSVAAATGFGLWTAISVDQSTALKHGMKAYFQFSLMSQFLMFTVFLFLVTKLWKSVLWISENWRIKPKSAVIIIVHCCLKVV